MAESTDRDNLPQATVVPKKQARISVVWLIPILAAVVGIGIAIQQILSEGPTITIVFKSAQGVEAGKTFIKYKDVNIGQVTAVELTDEFTRVQVTAKIAKSAAGLMVDDAKFWVVEPRVSLSGVSGLSTLLSGNYIGFEAGQSSSRQRKFVGLDVPPTITDQPGRKFVLQANDLGSLGIGSPIYFRRLTVGQVAAYDLAADGKSVSITVFINAPYDKFVSPETRFWNASGIDFSVGAGGVEVRTEGLVALLAGGLAFDTPAFLPVSAPAVENTAFTLYGDRDIAMKQPETIARRYVLYFSESLRGLSVGAPVTLFGLQAGEVTDVGLSFDPETLAIRPRVLVTFFPERIIARLSSKEQAAGMAMAEQRGDAHIRFLRAIVEGKGLRAQLASGNLLTGQMYIALEYFPNAPKVKIDWTADPLEIPTLPGGFADIQAKLTSILAKIDKMQLDAIGTDTRKTLETLNQTLKDVNTAVNRLNAEVTPELKKVLEEVRRATVSADQVLRNTDATLVGKDAPGQQELRDALQEVARAARSLRVLTDYLERHPDALIRGKAGEKP
ncbi:MAG: MlaD family protein [Burkholderiales bacterium]|nr:MlaD family protein [Burkholderiales bacterium]